MLLVNIEYIRILSTQAVGQHTNENNKEPISQKQKKSVNENKQYMLAFPATADLPIVKVFFFKMFTTP
jgi:hypothetical protein